MTNHWIDIGNADCVLIMGSNCAEHHPVSFKWVLRAKEKKGATLIHVDPTFSRTSARCDYHVPIRSGTDIAFLGGMVNYILQNKLYQEEYVKNYTNASFVVGKKFDFKDGVFSGYDPKTRKYDKSFWAFEKDDKGMIVSDPTLKNPRCVINLLKKHYSRYKVDLVSQVTGVSKENILKVYKQCIRFPALQRYRNIQIHRRIMSTGHSSHSRTLLHILSLFFITTLKRSAGSRAELSSSNDSSGLNFSDTMKKKWGDLRGMFPPNLDAYFEMRSAFIFMKPW